MPISKEQIILLVGKLKEQILSVDAVTSYFSQNNLFEELLEHFDFISMRYAATDKFQNCYGYLLEMVPSKYLLPLLGDIKWNSTRSYHGGLVDGEETSRDIQEFFRELTLRVLKDFPEQCLNYLHYLKGCWKLDSEAKRLLLITRMNFPEKIPEDYKALFVEIEATETSDSLNKLRLKEKATIKMESVLNQIFNA